MKKPLIGLAICFFLYALGVIAFQIASRPADAAPFDEAIFFYPIALLGLPIIGTLLMFWGFQLIERGGVEGIVPAPIVGLAAIPGGIALAIAFPLVVFFDNEGLSSLIIIRGTLAASLVCSIAAGTIVALGGPGCRENSVGRALAPLYDKVMQRIIEPSTAAPRSEAAQLTTEGDTKTTWHVSADLLILQYQRDEVNADATYKKRPLLVTGVIRKIGKDIMEMPYIILGENDDTDGCKCR